MSPSRRPSRWAHARLDGRFHRISTNGGLLCYHESIFTRRTSPDGTNCPGNRARPTPVGKRMHLDAMPAAGMRFMGWSGACSGTGGCDLNISGETQVCSAFCAAIA